MEALRKNLIILHTFVTLLLGWGIGLLLIRLYSDYYFGWYPFIPVFFYVMGWITILVVTSTKERSQLNIANLYLFLKIIKTTLSILFIGLYFFLIIENRKTFALVFSAYYLLYLGLETFFFYCSEKLLNKTL